MRLNGAPPGRLILLTAAVTPVHAFTGVLKDPTVRLKQYHTALGFWADIANRIDADVLVVETTGASSLTLLSPLSQTQRRKVAVFGHSPSMPATRKGIGAIEADAIDEVMLSLNGRRLVTKITGRLVVRNATDLVTSYDGGAFVARRTLDRKYVDSRLFQVPSELWTARLRGLGQDVDESAGRNLENVLAQRLIIGEYNAMLDVRHFPRRPLIEGASATTGRPYDRVFRRRLNMPLSWIERGVSALASKQT